MCTLDKYQKKYFKILKSLVRDNRYKTLVREKLTPLPERDNQAVPARRSKRRRPLTLHDGVEESSILAPVVVQRQHPRYRRARC